MGINTNQNPQSVLDAVINPSPLTVGQIALLEKAKSPVLFRNFDNMGDCIVATYLVNIPLREAYLKLRDAETLAIEATEWADKLGWDEYQEKFASLIVSLIKFWNMIPSQETEKKTEVKSQENLETVG